MPVAFRGVVLSAPGVATYIDDSRASSAATETINSVGIVGVAERGQPNIPLRFTDAASARAVYGEGGTSKPLVDGIIRALNAGAASVYGVRVGRAKPFSLSITNGAGTSTAVFVGTIADTVLTVTSIIGGVIGVGQTISGTGLTVGTLISGQISGTVGGVGTYRVSVSQTVATPVVISASSTELINVVTNEYGKFAKPWSLSLSPSSNTYTLTSNTNVFTGYCADNGAVPTLYVTAITTGHLFVGQTISGSTGGVSIASGTTIVACLSGIPGGVGTYQISTSNNVGSSTSTFTITGSQKNQGVKAALTIHTGDTYVVDNIYRKVLNIVSNSSSIPGTVSIGPSLSDVVTSFAGNISGNVLTVTSMNSGVLFIGQTISGTGNTSLTTTNTASGGTVTLTNTGNATGTIAGSSTSFTAPMVGGTITIGTQKTGLTATLATGTATVTLTNGGSTTGMFVGQILTKTTVSGENGAFGNSGVVTVATISGSNTTDFTVSTNHATAGAITFSASAVTATVASQTSGTAITLSNLSPTTATATNASYSLTYTVTTTPSVSIASGTTITDFGTGVGQTGTYTVSISQTVNSIVNGVGSAQEFGDGLTLQLGTATPTTYLFSDYPRIANLVTAINNDGKFRAAVSSGTSDSTLCSTLDRIPSSNKGSVPTYTSAVPFVATANVAALVDALNGQVLGGFVDATLKSTAHSYYSTSASPIPTADITGILSFKYILSSGAIFTGTINNGTTGNAGNILTVNSLLSGKIVLGMQIGGGQVPSGTTVVAYGSGTGGQGTYIVSSATTPNQGATQLVGAATYGTVTDYDPTPTAADWTNAFVTLQNVNTYFVVPMTDNASYHATALAHAISMSLPSGKKERMALLGGALGETYLDAKARAAALNDKRAVLCWPGVQDYDSTGVLQPLPPYYFAAQLAGILMAQNDPAMPLTNKAIPLYGVEINSTPAAVDELVNSGVFTVKPDITRGFVVVQSLTTWTGDLRFARREISTVRAADKVMQNVRDAVSPFIGQKSSLMMMDNLRQTVIRALDRSGADGLIFADPANPDLNPAYKDVSVRVFGDAYYVDFNISPAKPANYILITAYVS